MYSNNNQYYKSSSSIPSNANNRWGQQQPQHQAHTTNVNNANLSNILSLVGGLQQPQPQPSSEIDNLKQTSNANYVHPDAQHADAVLRAKAIAAHMKAKQIAAGFQGGKGHPPVVHHDTMMKASTSYSSLADNNTPIIGNNKDISNNAAMNNTANSWSLPDSLPPTLNTLDNRYKAPPSSHSLLPPTQAIAAANNNFSYKPANIATQQQQHIDELRMLNMDGSKQPILPPTSQTLGKFHPLKEEDSDEASLFSDTDDNKRRDEHMKELHKLNMDGSPTVTKAILKKLPQDGDEKKEEEEVDSNDESLFGSSSSSSDDEDEVFGQESSHVQHAKIMDKVQAVALPLKSADEKATTTKEAPSRRGKDVASLQRRGVTKPSSEVKKQKIHIFNPPTLKGDKSEDEDASSDDGSVYSEGDSKKKKKPTGSSKKSGGLLGGLLSKVGSKDKAQSKLYRESTKNIKRRDTTIKDLTPDTNNRSSEKEKKLQKFLQRQHGADALSGKTNVELYSTPSSTTTKAVPNTDTALTTKKKKKPTNNNDWQYSSQEAKWNKNYTIIQQYISKHGHSDIPEGHSLHKWVQSQRNICLRWIAGVNKNEDLVGSHLQRYVHVYKLHSINFDWGNTVDRRVLHDVLAVVDMNLSPAQRETLFPKMIKKKLPKQNLALKKRKGLVKSESVFDSISSKRKQERDDTRYQGKKLARNVTDHNSSDEGGGSVNKERPSRDEDIIEFTDIDSDSISWNDHTKKPKKRRKAALNNMPANQWVHLLMKFKERYTSSSKVLPSSNKCWSDLTKAGDDEEESIDLSALVRSKIVEEQLQNSINEAAAKASSEEMMTISELKKSKEGSKEAAKAKASPEKSKTSTSQEPLRVLKNGKKVYAGKSGFVLLYHMNSCVQ